MSRRDGWVTHPTAGTSRLAFARHYAAGPEEVWGMLTDPARTQLWWARVDALDLTPGGRVDLQWLNADEVGVQPRATGTVAELDPGRLLALATDIFGVLRFELTPAGTGTDLAFSATLAVDPAWEAKMLAGWHWRFDALADALAGHPVDWVDWGRDQWVAHQKRYTEKLGWNG